jgi:cytochrome c oxidase cbb3-type subunit 2
MKMTPFVVLVGATVVLLSVILTNVIMPVVVFRPHPGPNTVAYSALELEGREVYIQNGCLYCHSQQLRPQDWDQGSGEAAEPGDYAFDSPHLTGSLRTGPDLLREGGYHTDDWHWAHFEDPRYTRPQSIMPSFNYIKGHQRTALIAYIQALGGKPSRSRAAEQERLRTTLIAYYRRGPAVNVAHLNSTMPHEWLTMPNPVPVTLGSVQRGHVIYNAFCVGCHGEFGDGRGPARAYLSPPPMDFTLLQASGANPSVRQPGYHYNPRTNRVSPINNGAIYYAVFHGIPGSAMPIFKGQLESEKIWDVGNYIGNAFMGWRLEPVRGRYEELAMRPSRPDRGATSPS